MTITPTNPTIKKMIIPATIAGISAVSVKHSNIL